MRVLYDHTTFVMQRHGGISRYFAEMIPRIAADPGVQVSVYMGLYLSRYDLPTARRHFAHFGGVRRPFIRKTHQLALAVSNQLLGRFARKADPEIYHATHYTTLLPTFTGKRVITMHDLIDELFHNGPSPRAIPQRQAVFDAADGIICVSEHTRQDLQRIYQVPDEKIRVIHHGNSLLQPAEGPALFDEPYILYVGRRSGYKNFDLLLAVYSRNDALKKFRLVCFGDSFSRTEEQLIESLGSTGRVNAIQGDDRVLANLYAYAAVFVYPSRYEGFGMPLLEAMHYGCPVLAAKISSIPEVAGEAAMYFNPNDADDLRTKLQDLLYDDAARQKLGRVGKARSTQFSWERCARETADFYRWLLR